MSSLGAGLLTGVTIIPTEAVSSRELTPSLAFWLRPYGLYIMPFIRRSAFLGQCMRKGTGSPSCRQATCTCLRVFSKVLW